MIVGTVNRYFAVGTIESGRETRDDIRRQHRESVVSPPDTVTREDFSGKELWKWRYGRARAIKIGCDWYALPRQVRGVISSLQQGGQ